MSSTIPRILALETSGTAGSAALWQGAQLLGERVLDPARRSAQTLAPAVDELLRGAGWAGRDVGVVAVVMGPGSFTGLRVGVTTAKAFAYAVGAQVIAVGTLEVVARQAPVELLGGERPCRVRAILDAQRGELFAAEFDRSAVNWTQVHPPRIVAPDEWLGELSAGSIVTGAGLSDALRKRLPAGVTVAPAEHWPPMASTVARIAAERAARGAFDNMWRLVPLYLRRSAAEERRLSRPGNDPVAGAPG